MINFVIMSKDTTSFMHLEVVKMNMWFWLYGRTENRLFHILQTIKIYGCQLHGYANNNSFPCELLFPIL